MDIVTDSASEASTSDEENEHSRELSTESSSCRFVGILQPCPPLLFSLSSHCIFFSEDESNLTDDAPLMTVGCHRHSYDYQAQLHKTMNTWIPLSSHVLYKTYSRPRPGSHSG